MYDTSWMIRMLQNNVCNVTFTKRDGSVRVLRCTLQDQYLPEQYRGKGHLLSETDRNSLSVWDVDTGDWRSFILDSVNGVSVDSSSGPQLLV
jgi:hypothetical protein